MSVVVVVVVVLVVIVQQSWHICYQVLFVHVTAVSTETLLPPAFMAYVTEVAAGTPLPPAIMLGWCSKCGAPHIPDPVKDKQWQFHPAYRQWFCPGCTQASSRDAKKEFEAVTEKVFCDEQLYKEARKQWWGEYWISLVGKDRQADVDWISPTYRSLDKEAAVDMIGADMIGADVDMIDENDL